MALTLADLCPGRWQKLLTELPIKLLAEAAAVGALERVPEARFPVLVEAGELADRRILVDALAGDLGVGAAALARCRLWEFSGHGNAP